MPIDILMPPLSQTSDTLLLLEWLKQPGDPVRKGEALFTVETDKASLEVEAPESGTLYEILANPNTEIEVRSVIGRILKEGEEPPGEQGQHLAAPVHLEKSGLSEKPDQSEIPSGSTSTPQERSFSSPRARRLAAQHGIDISQVAPSGPRGMVVESDVESLIKTTDSKQVSSAEGTTDLPMNSVRKVIAQRMMESHLGHAPVTYMSEVDATELVNLRKRMLAGLREDAIHPTFSDFLIFLVCQALRQHKQLNAIQDGDVLTIFDDIHMGLAVDTDRGLIVPVLRKAGGLDIHRIAVHRLEMVQRAQTGKSSPGELSGGTFTLTNLGALGVDHFTPIINSPQVAILGIGRIREVPAVKDGGIFIRSMVGLALTCDHRFIDGAPAARFMQTLNQLIENPQVDT